MDSKKQSTTSKSASARLSSATTTVYINGREHEIDLEELSQRVYSLLQFELRIERERLGRPR